MGSLSTEALVLLPKLQDLSDVYTLYAVLI